MAEGEGGRREGGGVRLRTSAIIAAMLSTGVSTVASARVPAVQDSSYRLSHYLNSAERAAPVWAALRQAMPTILARSEKIRDRPELSKRVLDDVWSLATRRLEQKLPLLWEAIASVYRRRLSKDECASLLAFYSSAANERLTHEMVRRMDLARLVDGQLDPARSAGIAARAYPAALAALPSAERTLIEAFKASPLAVKYATLRPDLSAARQTWIDEIEPTIIAEVESAADRIAAETMGTPR